LKKLYFQLQLLNKSVSGFKKQKLKSWKQLCLALKWV
jgi:hypothetical protein